MTKRTAKAKPATRIEYSKDTRDFDAYLNGEYIGSFRSYLAADEALNAARYEAAKLAGRAVEAAA